MESFVMIFVTTMTYLPNSIFNFIKVANPLN